MAHTLMANNARIVIHPVSSVQALDLSSAQVVRLLSSSTPLQLTTQLTDFVGFLNVMTLSS
jgi:hypothetical protein